MGFLWALNKENDQHVTFHFLLIGVAALGCYSAYFWNHHGELFCCFWCIHEFSPKAVSPWGISLNPKSCFPFSNSSLPIGIGKMASVLHLLNSCFTAMFVIIIIPVIYTITFSGQFLFHSVIIFEIIIMNKDGLTFFPHRSHGAKVNQQVLTIEDLYRGK